MKENGTGKAREGAKACAYPGFGEQLSTLQARGSPVVLSCLLLCSVSLTLSSQMVIPAPSSSLGFLIYESMN